MSLYDKSMGKEARAAMEFAEDARETEWVHPSYSAMLYQGQVKWELIHPFPRQSDEDKQIGDAFVAKLKAFLEENYDADEVDKSGEIPDSVLKGLAKLGCFAMKIPKQYNGLGLSQVNYNRALHLTGSYCGNLTALLSAHQSIGVPQPLLMFGTDEQKEKFLPRFRDGAISAFALTETNAGSDPRAITTAATITEDGSHYVINGEKLWCTNGTKANVIVVMAVTAPKMVRGKERKQITAFLVEMDTPGVEVLHRCRFMGLKALYNGVIRFTDVKIPKENMILGEGDGLRLALKTLNTGRLSIPAGVTGNSKWCMKINRKWTNERVQWGHPIGEHETIAGKQAKIASDTFAMDAVWKVASTMADDKHFDIRLEAAIAKTVQHRSPLRTAAGNAANSWRTRLRNRRIPACARRRRSRNRTCSAGLPSESDLRRFFGNHAPVYRSRSARFSSAAHRSIVQTRRDDGRKSERTAEDDESLCRMVSETLDSRFVRWQVRHVQFATEQTDENRGEVE